jgi:hypothetical protein
MSENITWGCCLDNNGSDVAYIKCIICKMVYHISCMSIPDVLKESDWNCPKCTIRAPKTTKTDHTPIRNIKALRATLTDHTPLRNVSVNRGNKKQATNTPSPPTASSNRDTMISTIQEVLRSEFDKMLKQFNDSLKFAINQELQPIKEEMKDIKEAMSFINQNYEKIKIEQEISTQKIRDLEMQNKKLKEIKM